MLQIGRQIVSQDNPSGVSRLGRSGRDPGSRPYAPITPRSGKPRRKHYPHSPCRFGAGAGIFRGSRRHSCGTASSPLPGLRRRRSHRSTSSHQARHRHRTYTNHQHRATDPPPVPSRATGGASRVSVAEWVVDGLLREGDVTRIARRQSGRHISRRAEPGSSESSRRGVAKDQEWPTWCSWFCMIANPPDLLILWPRIRRISRGGPRPVDCDAVLWLIRSVSDLPSLRCWYMCW